MHPWVSKLAKRGLAGASRPPILPRSPDQGCRTDAPRSPRWMFEARVAQHQGRTVPMKRDGRHNFGVRWPSPNKNAKRFDF